MIQPKRKFSPSNRKPRSHAREPVGNRSGMEEYAKAHYRQAIRQRAKARIGSACRRSHAAPSRPLFGGMRVRRTRFSRTAWREQRYLASSSWRNAWSNRAVAFVRRSMFATANGVRGGIRTPDPRIQATSAFAAARGRSWSGLSLRPRPKSLGVARPVSTPSAPFGPAWLGIGTPAPAGKRSPTLSESTRRVSPPAPNFT